MRVGSEGEKLVDKPEKLYMSEVPLLRMSVVDRKGTTQPYRWFVMLPVYTSRRSRSFYIHFAFIREVRKQRKSSRSPK